MPEALPIILCEDRLPHSAANQLHQALLTTLAAWPAVHVKVLPHLYDLAPEGPGVAYLRALAGDMLILGWLYPRAAYWILDANGIAGRMGHTTFFPDDELTPAIGGGARSPSDRTIWCLDLRPHQDAAPLLGEIERIVVARGGAPRPAELVAATGNGQTRLDEKTRPRWYPVVDRHRCHNCLECLNFCLFGVFGLGPRGELLVEQPDACRNGCPACARVCPAGAIVFPSHADAAIAGDPRAAVGAGQGELPPWLRAATPAEVAAAERAAALGPSHPSPTPPPAPRPAAPSPPKDDLDGLVDQLDGEDL
jgi:NAD-dependent dihydropyrimidine dehydrogenase PreA subunit